MFERMEWHDDEILRDVDELVSGVVKEVAEAIAVDAKRRCPVGEFERDATWSRPGRSGARIQNASWAARRPGTLRDSIKAVKSKFQNGGWIVQAGSWDAFYASFVELGLKTRKKYPRQPYLRPALERNGRTFKSKLEGALK